VEGYRALAETCSLGRTIASVEAQDAWYLKGGLVAEAVQVVLIGRGFVRARRRGKLMMLDVAEVHADEPSQAEGVEAVLGLRFGMSGRLVCDGRLSVDSLLYSPIAASPQYDRFAVVFADGGRLVMNDPRRLGGVELDPDETRLGPDSLGISAAELKRALVGAQVALKARLLDQSKVAGIGNLIADEVLWRAGLAPVRPAASLTGPELRRLHRHLTSGLQEVIERGGSHTGDLIPHRRPGGRCPRDQALLVRASVGGRTTWWCPVHQV
jgi:formamidopyrimidine-DNA glycosylase